MRRVRVGSDVGRGTAPVRRAATAACAALVLVTSMVGTGPAAGDAPLRGPLHTSGSDTLVYDPAGNPVRLVGFNWTGTENGGRNDFEKAADSCGVTWRTPSDRIGNLTVTYDDMYQRMAEAGYNVVRIPISWHNLEPVAPTWDPAAGMYQHAWNPTYVNDLKSMVSGARAAGLMVILDMHQDYWSPALHNITNWDGSRGYCEGVGMPRWLYPTIDAKSSTTQTTDFYNGMNWFFRDIHDPAATVTRSTPWQLLYAAWDYLGYVFSSESGFADHGAVVGADLLNEPYFSYVGGNPPSGQTVLQAAGTRLKAFYEAIAPAITVRHPEWLLFFQDCTGGYNASNPALRETPTMTAKPAVAGNWVYSLHIYNFGYGTFSDGVTRHDDFGITVAEQALAKAEAWGVPLYFGEFTLFTLGVDARDLTEAGLAQTERFLAWTKENRVSWTFWAYVNPYRPMTMVDYTTNEPIDLVEATLAAGLDSTSPPPLGVVASDAFGRTVSGGWGSADVGGSWSVTGTASNWSVSGGLGSVVLPSGGQGRSAYLNAVSSASSEVAVQVRLAKVATGGGTYVSVIGRRVTAPAVGEYRAKVQYLSTGAVRLFLTRVAGTTETTIATLSSVPGVSMAAGETLNVRFQAQGAGPTGLRLRVWESGTSEPSTWQLSGSDSTAALQASGGVGFVTYLSSSTSNAPQTISFDSLTVTTP